MKILVTGSRGWTDKKAIAFELENAINGDVAGTTLIHGGANGADNLANEIALELGITVHMYPANWDLYGKKAGILRNIQMLDEEEPDLVIAFWDGHSRGTAHMIDYARQKNYQLRIILDQGYKRQENTPDYI